MKIINLLESQIISINCKMISNSKVRVPLSKVAILEKKTNRLSNDGMAFGDYIFFTNEENATKFLYEYDFDGEYIIANTGGKANFNYFKGKFAVMSDSLVIKIIDENATYFYYNILKHYQKLIDTLGFEGSGLKHLNKKWLLNFAVPRYCEYYESYIKTMKLLTKKVELEKNILTNFISVKKYLLSKLFV